MPETGRFTGKDPFKGDGLNLYVYVKSNPMRFVDPSGYCAAEGQMPSAEYNKYYSGILHNQLSVFAIGFSIDVIAGTGSLQFVIDKKGNVGILFSGGFKGKTDIEGGVSVVATFSDNMEDAYDLSGVGSYYGAGIDLGEVIAISGDYTFSPIKREDGSYVSSQSISGGLNASFIPAEIHTGVVKSKVVAINVIEIFEALAERIEEIKEGVR
jgi:hypothetical protein